MPREATSRPAARSGGLLALVAGYTVVGVAVLPFSVVLAIFAPMVVVHPNSPSHPTVLPATLLLFGVPLLIVVGMAGGWVSWYRRRRRAALLFLAVPVLYGCLVIAGVAALSP